MNRFMKIHTKLTSAEVLAIVEAHINKTLAPGKRARVSTITANHNNTTDTVNRPTLELEVTLDVVEREPAQ